MPDVLIVTGGGRGIGAAIVRAAARRAYSVCFGYRSDHTAAAGLVAEIAAEGRRAYAIQADMTDPATPARLFDAAEAAFGPVTAVVNNAGITGPIGPFADTTLETMRRTIDTNLLGPMVMAQEAVRRWRRAAIPGRLVNVSSTAATLGAPGEYVHYAATKAALDALTVGLGKEVAAEGIRINAVAPGMIETEIHAAAGDPDRLTRVVSRVPMARVGQAEEIARAVLWLLSDEASYVTATVLKVSGGL